jgi:hypothetical protein
MIDDEEREKLAQAHLADSYEHDMTAEEQEAEDRKNWEDRLQSLGNGNQAEAEDFERLRKPIELRMLEDLRQYKGIEVKGEGNRNSKSSGSDLNVNITRKKTNTAEARLSDMLFPADDKNYGIDDPDQDPKLTSEDLGEAGPVGMEEPQEVPSDAGLLAPGQVPGAPAPQMQQGQSADMAPGAPAVQQQLAIPEDPNKKAVALNKIKANLMEQAIDNQLADCGYGAVGRQVIRSGCLLGTGVIKGPVLLGKARRSWVLKKDEAGNTAYVLKDVADNKPGFEFVPVWDFFPTMSATRVEDSEITFQRHWMTRRDLIRLAKRDDFLKDQVRKVLKTSPDKTPPDYLTQIRSMTDVTAVGDEKRYIVWERHGPITRDELITCGCLEAGDEEEDPLEEYQGVTWTCSGIVIKAAVNAMDTEDQPFSVFCFEDDDSSIFGYGVPFLMRQAAAVVKAAWRMIMDNASLSVGGQIIINKQVIDPAADSNGVVSWDITPLKVWLLKDKMAKAQDAFHVFEFPNHQNELAAIFNMARQLADEETGIPLISEGEQGNQGPQGSKTLGGMEMLMNNHNIIMRRAVKNWDDNVTIPCITRLYDWNMQYNANNDIKGDFTAVARGSSALLQKETQGRNMLNLVNFLVSPAFAPWTKFEPVAKKLVTSMQHDPTELLKSKEEFDADVKSQQEAAQQQGGDDRGKANIEIQRMKNDVLYKIHQERMANLGAERQFKAAIVDVEKEIEMMKLAQGKEITLEKIASDLQKIREKSQADRTLMADEFKVKLETGSGV